ncbi:ATP synthase F1 subunit epsilon [Candidatus Gottesmanbacteria bacterium]|nr:ATP synthase F1 subunit epsilon [Candidatus Gottesmanbacteria bacterium]
MNTLNLELITPEKIAFQDSEVLSVTVPSEDGQIGILPHHTSLLAKLTDGEMKIVKKNEELFVAIGGGFIEVRNNKVTILVTRAVHARELNEKEILDAQKRAQEVLKTKPTDDAFVEAQNLYRRSLLDMKVLRRRMKTR